MRQIALNHKNSLITFRFVTFLFLIFFLLYNPNWGKEVQSNLLLPLNIYLTSVIGLIFLSEKILEKSWFQLVLFLFDIIIISWSIYLFNGWTSDLYLIYFLVIFMSGIQMRIWQSFAVGTLACLIYLFFVLKSSAEISLNTHILLRFPFFYLASFYAAFFTHYTREASQRLEKAYNDQVAHAEQRALMGRLSSRIAAELTNPLSIIMGFAQSIVKRTAITHELHVPAASILRETGRCKEMIENLLSLSDEVKQRIEMVDINLVVQNVLKELAVPPDIETELVLAPSLPMIEGSKKRLFNALKNVMENSIKAMPSGGKMTVTSRLVEPNSSELKRFESNDSNHENMIEVGIADTGTGIPNEIRERIFEPFFTTRQGRKSGLGLSITSAIVQRHKGAINFETQLGQGTRFVLRFRASDKSAN